MTACVALVQAGTASGSHWLWLPSDLLTNVFQRLPKRDRKAGRLVCLDWCNTNSGTVTRLRLSQGPASPIQQRRSLWNSPRSVSLQPLCAACVWVASRSVHH